MDGQAIPAVATLQSCVTKKPKPYKPSFDLEPWIVCDLSIGPKSTNFCDVDHVAEAGSGDLMQTRCAGAVL